VLRDFPTWLPAACLRPETILGMQSGCTEDLLIGPGRGPAGRVSGGIGASGKEFVPDQMRLAARQLSCCQVVLCAAAQRHGQLAQGAPSPGRPVARELLDLPLVK
jgi:hypothetical protein